MPDPATLEQVVTEDIDTDQDLAQLLKLVGIRSLRHNLKTEDDAIRRDFEFYDGSAGGSVPKKGADPVDIMVAHGDVHIYERPPQTQPSASASVQVSSPQTQPEPPAASPVQQPTQQSGGLSSLAKAAVVAALVGGPVLGGLAGYYFSRPSTTVVQPVQPGDTVGIENVPAGPPHPDRRKFK